MRQKPEHGQSLREPKLRRLPERFTAISKEALLKQKLFTIRIYLTVVHIMEPKRKVL